MTWNDRHDPAGDRIAAREQADRALERSDSPLTHLDPEPQRIHDGDEDLEQRPMRPTRLDQMSGASRLGAIASAAAQGRSSLSLEAFKRAFRRESKLTIRTAGAYRIKAAESRSMPVEPRFDPNHSPAVPTDADRALVATLLRRKRS